MNENTTISDYLIQRLQDVGIKHIFGVPGDYILAFFKELENSPIGVINTSDEQGAGFAADAYARTSGIGAVCITYSVGGLKVANTTAQAFAEKSPVLVISGSPGLNERTRDPLLHHKVKDFDTQLNIFRELTVAATALEDPRTACAEIDRVIDAVLRFKRPGYIEIPRDMVGVKLPDCRPEPQGERISPPKVLKEAVDEAVEFINRAKHPVLLAGVELSRFRLQDKLRELADTTGFPVAVTPLAKSVISENHPGYIGVYEGAMGREEVTNLVESSDALLMLGTFLTDVNLGICTAQLERGRSIYATSEKTFIRYHNYDGLRLEDVLDGLLDSRLRRRKIKKLPRPVRPKPVIPTQDGNLSVEFVFDRLSRFVDEKTVVLADPGDAMFAGMDMVLPDGAEFISPAYYTSLGFAVPAALGVQTARPHKRPLVLVGDGAFQMTGMELSTIARFGLNPVIILLNNRGYGTERPMIDGRFNDVLDWEYSRIPEILKSGRGWKVATQVEFENALREAKEYTDGFTLIDVQIDQRDISKPLQRLTASLGKRARAE